MSDSIFGDEYAAQYDLIYGGKNYEVECDFIEEAFRRYGIGPTQTVLDVGCGTGNHSIPLVRRGYHLTGVDLSSAMLARAQRKGDERLRGLGVPPPEFLTGDMRTFQLESTFDAVLMMFGGLGYQLTSEAVVETFQNVRRHLRVGGLFVSDLWYGPAVLAIRPSDQVKSFESPHGKLIRFATGSLDVLKHTAEIRFRLWKLNEGQEVTEATEVHRVRYFFAQELAFFLKSAGLELIRLSAFPNLDKPADETSWNVSVVARAF